MHLKALPATFGHVQQQTSTNLPCPWSHSFSLLYCMKKGILSGLHHGFCFLHCSPDESCTGVFSCDPSRSSSRLLGSRLGTVKSRGAVVGSFLHEAGDSAIPLSKLMTRNPCYGVTYLEAISRRKRLFYLPD